MSHCTLPPRAVRSAIAGLGRASFDTLAFIARCPHSGGSFTADGMRVVYVVGPEEAGRAGTWVAALP